MGAYNVRTLTYKNQTQVRFFKKPIEYDKKKVRANERKKKTGEERTQFDIDLSIRQSMHRTKDKIWNICLLKYLCCKSCIFFQISCDHRNLTIAVSAGTHKF